VSVGFEDLLAASRRIADCVHVTPVMTSTLLDELTGCRLSFKCENLQRTGAFKVRGAHNAVLSLSSQARQNGVATHSSGNHAAALALAARHIGVPAFIAMPDNATSVKLAAVRAYGGNVSLCKPTLAAREEALAELCERTGAAVIPPYDHPHVIAGQGTWALEMSRQLALPPEIILAPVGGGGLLAGSAVAARALWPGALVIGAEPSGADDARRSLISGERQLQTSPDTLADGLRTALGECNFPLIRDHVDDILTADDASIIDSMRLLWTRMKLVVEPSAAVVLAVVLTYPTVFSGRRVAAVLSGGNVDIDRLPWR
tara:strand:+ start:6259 stop:7206 length:948 start_codon:yes stop_codon:yes gene_type:complete